MSDSNNYKVKNLNVLADKIYKGLVATILALGAGIYIAHNKGSEIRYHDPVSGQECVSREGFLGMNSGTYCVKMGPDGRVKREEVIRYGHRGIEIITNLVEHEKGFEDTMPDIIKIIGHDGNEIFIKRDRESLEIFMRAERELRKERERNRSFLRNLGVYDW